MSKDYKFPIKYSVIFILLCLLGSWISWQTVLVHFETKNGLASTGSVCNISQEFNCQAVVTSEWSEIVGIPLGAFGVAFYLSLVLLLLHSYYSKFWSTRQLLILYTPALLLSVLASCFLFYISKFVVQVLCPLCLMLYGINILMLILVLVAIYQTKAGSSLLQIIYQEYRQLLGSLKNNLIKFKISALSEYLLSLGLISVLLLGVLVLLRFTEGNYKSKIISWPTNERLAIDLKLQSGINDDYYFGDLNAPVQIVEFADFQCPACRHLGSKIKDWLSEYQGKYYFVYLHYPLDQICNSDMKRPFHQIACYLSEISRCAGEQQKFWEVYYYLVRLEQESFLGDVQKGADKILKDLTAFAALDPIALQACLDSGHQLENIKDDIKRAGTLKIASTPSLFINGQRVRNLSEQSIKNIMKKVLEK